MKNRMNETHQGGKNIGLLQTAVLATLSKRALLLLVLCLLAIPQVWGEEVTTATDSTSVSDTTVVSGPKRAHWYKDYYLTKDYNNETDYAKTVAVVVGGVGGTVSLSAATGNGITGVVEDGSPSGNGETTAYINWNSSSWGIDKSAGIAPATIAAAHKLKVTFTATAEAGYNFAGWSTSQTGTSYDKGTNSTFTETITIGGDNEGYTSYKEVALFGESAPKTYGKNERYPTTYYAHFVPSSSITIKLADAVNGSYDCTYENENGETVTARASEVETIVTSKPFALEATAAGNYKFFGWYTIGSDNKENYFSYEKSVTGVTFAVNTEVYAKFIPEYAALFAVKGDETNRRFWNLKEACQFAIDNNHTVVYPIDNGTLYPLVNGELYTGEISEETVITSYSIPEEGVTLYIPYSKNSEPKGRDVEIVKDEDFVKTNCNVYSKLTLAEGVTIDVWGNIEVGAQQVAKGQNSKTTEGNNGAIYQGYGEIIMSQGSYINLKADAFLYAWGRITGSPESKITAESGSTVYESFQITDFQGGTRTTAMYNDRDEYKIFPFSQYYIQNIEVPLRIRHGAKELVNAALVANSMVVAMKDLPIIGNKSAMFTTTAEESYVEKMYDETKDRQIFKINGNATLTNFSFTYIGNTINTVDFLLPLTNNMDIYLEHGTVNLEANVILTADAKVEVKQDVTVNLNSNVFVYDSSDWIKGFVFQNKIIAPLQYTIPYSTVRTTVSDATIQVDGELIVNGNLYVSPNKANICSTGTGKVSFPNGNTCEETYPVYHLKETKGSLMFASVSDTYETSFIPAQLHNDKDMNPYYHYTETSGAVAGDEFWYVGSLGKWVKNEPLDIVDADNTNNKTLTINANGWASTGWPYTINGTEYGKDDKAGKEKYRQADRTLVITYSGEPNADMPIVVKNASNEIVSSHIYKVPFVYNTSNATLSGTDENSKNRIVFVKSGTLSIEEGTTASAKEIYVAPGAELEVNGTLTVGKLVLRTTPWQAAVLTIGTGGSIKLADGGQVYYSRIAPNKSTITDLHNTEMEYNSARYYQFGLPLECPLANVKMSNTDKLGGSQPKYGTAWMLKSYSESNRAANGISNSGANWVALASTGTITAGVGYEMFSNSNYYREFYFPVNLSEATNQVSVQYTGGAIGAEHNGWNIITSPLTSRAKVPTIDPATDIKVCWLNEDGSYSQEQLTVIPPAIPFSCQVSPKEGTLTFTLTFDANLTTAAAAPRRQSAAEAATETEWVHLDINNAEGRGDETSIFVHPTRFEQTYKIGIDVAKQSLTASRAILYSAHAYGYMAFAGVADTLLEKGIDLIVYSPAEQELTISLRENAFLNRFEYLWLADNETGARTDLLMDDYTFRADAGTAKGRFVLNGRFKAPQITTNITNTVVGYNIYALGHSIAISGVEQGTPIYVFDAVGRMLYAASASASEVTIPTPCAGVYMLSVGGKTAKMVIR